MQRSIPAGQVVNLTFHGIGTPSRPLDPGEGRTWVSVAQFETALDEVVDRRDDVRITFDDGNASDVEIALPRLAHRGLTASFFVLAGRIGEPGRLDTSDVHELIGAGMSVGSHGWAHRDWRTLTQAEAVEEFEVAPRVLSDITGRRVSEAAIPFGSYDRHVLRHLRRAGVMRVFSSDGGVARRSTWLQPRTSLHCDASATSVRAVVNGTEPAWRRGRRQAVRTVKRFRG